MKKLSKIKLQNAVVLEDREMKVIYGGSGGSGGSGGGYSFCCVDGDCAGPIVNCTTAYCEKYYGSGAYCD